MNLYSFWRSLTADQRKAFCKKAAIGYRYMDNHLVHKTKKPSIRVVHAMVLASNKELTHEGVIKFFVSDAVAKEA